MLICQFDAEFLAVPQECLILTMKANQKYFPLLDAAGQLTNRFLVVSNIAPADPSRGHRRQRARRAAAPGRCQVLLRPGPQAHARIARAGARQGRLSRQARHPGRARAARARDRGLAIGERLGADAGARRPRRAARQGRPADRHGRRVPRAAGRSWAATTRAHDGEAAEVAAGDRGPLQPALRRRRAAAQPRSAWRSRSPTSSRRWSACSASARCRPATRIRSRCAATR